MVRDLQVRTDHHPNSTSAALCKLLRDPYLLCPQKGTAMYVLKCCIQLLS